MLNWIYEKIIKKIDLPILLIAFIILCIVLSENKDGKEGFKEGLSIGDAFKKIGQAIKENVIDPAIAAAEKLFNEIKNAMGEFVEMLKRLDPTRIFNEMRDKLEGIVNVLKNGLNKAGKVLTDQFDIMKDGIMKFGKMFTDGIAKITDGLKDIRKVIFGPIENIFTKIKRVFEGYGEVMEGIGIAWFDLNKGVWLGFNSEIELFSYVGEYMFTNLYCGLRYLVFLPACIFFYLLDAFFILLYMPIRIMLFMISSVATNQIYEYETYFWKIIRDIDYECFKSTGLNFIKWPKVIRDQCYNCKRLKLETLSKKADQVGQTQRDIFNDVGKRGLQHINHGSQVMRDAM